MTALTLGLLLSPFDRLGHCSTERWSLSYRVAKWGLELGSPRAPEPGLLSLSPLSLNEGQESAGLGAPPTLGT